MRQSSTMQPGYVGKVIKLCQGLIIKILCCCLEFFDVLDSFYSFVIWCICPSHSEDILNLVPNFVLIVFILFSQSYELQAPLKPAFFWIPLVCHFNFSYTPAFTAVQTYSSFCSSNGLRLFLRQALCTWLFHLFLSFAKDFFQESQDKGTSSRVCDDSKCLFLRLSPLVPHVFPFQIIYQHWAFCLYFYWLPPLLRVWAPCMRVMWLTGLFPETGIGSTWILRHSSIFIDCSFVLLFPPF